MASPERKSFPLRLDPKLFDALRAWADQELRSVNAQIEFLLRQAVERREGGKRDGQEPRESR